MRHRLSAAAALLVGMSGVLWQPSQARAQAGPPFLTNDPGTPGNANWEINVASMQTLARGQSSYQTPQVDLNFGVGDRIQLTYEIPYVLQADAGQRVRSGWSNAYPRERILGFCAGRSVSERLELDAEIYDDRADDATPHATTADVGGRYKLGRGFIALFMAGRSLTGFGSGQPEFMGYVGVQILLSDYGRALTRF
jgi:hypothetical protein